MKKYQRFKNEKDEEIIKKNKSLKKRKYNYNSKMMELKPLLQKEEKNII